MIRSPKSNPPVGGNRRGSPNPTTKSTHQHPHPHPHRHPVPKSVSSSSLSQTPSSSPSSSSSANFPLIAELAGSLSEETDLLKRLLYRNQNQHGRMKYFSFLRKCERVLGLVPLKDISRLSSIADTKIRDSTMKLGREDILSTIQVHNDVQKLIVLLHEITDVWLYRASEEIVVHLRRKVFVPLLTLSLAMGARIAELSTAVKDRFNLQLKAMRSKLLHVSSANPKYSQLISDKMCDPPDSPDSRVCQQDEDKSSSVLYNSDAIVGDSIDDVIICDHLRIAAKKRKVDDFIEEEDLGEYIGGDAP